MKQTPLKIKKTKKILPLCLLIILIFLLSTLSLQAQEVNPPAPQMQQIYPPSNTVVTDNVEFIFDFNDKENDIDYLQIDIVGPSPYDLPISKIQLILNSDEIDPFQSYNNSQKALFSDMGISAVYNNNTQQWNLSINSHELWNYSNPWTQPVGSSVWPTGQYHFFIKARDQQGNKWGGELSYGSYSHYAYCFHSIQTMIDSITPPSTIHVLSGLYTENILINKSDITLNGLSDPIIDGKGSTCVHVTGDNVLINNFIIENSSDSDGSEIGIYCDNVNNIDITNNELLKHNFGITIEDSDQVTIDRNEIHANWIPTTHTSYQDCLNGGIGINIVTITNENTNHTIQNNKIYDQHRQGIYVGSPSRNLDDSSSTHYIVIKDNSIYDNGLTWSVCNGFPGGSGDEYGIYLSSADHCVIGPNNKIYNHEKWSEGAAIFLQNSRENDIVSNMMMTVGNSSLMAQGKIDSNSRGIILYNQSINNNINSNDITNNAIGILIHDSTNGSDSGFGNSIQFNNIKNNPQYGIAYGLGGGATTIISAQHNWWGTGYGPYHPTVNPSGGGNPVSDNINFSDWLTFDWYNNIWVDNYYDSGTPGWNITHFDTINKGVAAAFPYSIIKIKPGTYQELLKIDRPLTLDASFGADVTTITDEGSTYSQMEETNGHTIQIASSNVVIKDLSILRTDFTSYHPIAAIGNSGEPELSNININNCTIESLGYCLFFNEGDQIQITDNIFFAQIDDCIISMTNNTQLSIVNNTLDDYNVMGIYLDNCSDAIIKANIINQKSFSGVELNGCYQIDLINNAFDYNYENGVTLKHSQQIDIIDSTFKNTEKAVVAEKNVTLRLTDNYYHPTVSFEKYGLLYLDDENRYYGDVQHAVNRSMMGGFIEVNPGHYFENVIINKKLTLEGNGTAKNITIEGNDTHPTVFIGGNHSVKQIKIDGISIKKGNYGVQTKRNQDISGLSIVNCKITDALITSLYIDPHNYSDIPPIRDGTDLFSSAVVIRNNFIRGGIHYRFHTFEVYGVEVNTQLKLLDNDIDSVFFDGSIAVELRNNHFHSVGFTYSNDIQINNNIFENPWEERYGLYLWSLDGMPPNKNINITHNTITGYSSFAVGGGVSGQGIVIAGAFDVDIRNNQILANTDGIWITEEYINKNGDLCIGDVIDVNIINNDIENGQNGIRLTENVSNLRMEQNKLNINGKGIWLHKSSDHLISNNSFIGNYYGIRIDDGSEDNIIYNNYFKDNFISAYDPYSSTNKYNISRIAGRNIMGGPYLGGNYWDDYLGEDNDGDGIGDDLIPYNASGEIAHTGDYLPLVFTDDVPPEITVEFPNGGEVLSGDITIQWDASDDIDPNLSIDIEYSADNGLSWMIISPNEQNDGEYIWNTSSLDEGTAYLIRITATDSFGNMKNDTSDSTFSIYRDFPGPDMSLNHPQMGYVYFFGLQKVRFLSQNCFAIGHLDIEAEIQSNLAIEKVEFYIDDLLMHIAEDGENDVYTWRWDEPVLFTHEIKVIAYDIHGATSEESIEVTIFNFNIIP